MIIRRRGVLAALLLAAAISVIPGGRALAGGDHFALATGETVLPDGLTSIFKRATASGAVALEVWIRCPSDGWSASQPGIARLAAFAAVSAKVGGASLRDAVRADGADLSISVFQTATEIAILAPANAAPDLQDGLIARVFHASIDAAAFDEAKTRLAEQQAAQSQAADALLRDGVFSALFSSGPMHDSTLGDTQALKAASLADVREFVAQSYVPGNAIVVAIGNLDPSASAARLAASAPPPARARPMPTSARVSSLGGSVNVAPQQAGVPGIALAWIGPPVSDQRAATAMDFLSDYLADAHAGTLAQAVAGVNAGASFSGQFITLQDPGIFFASATGASLDASAVDKAMRTALGPIVSGTLDRTAFSRALGAYETRLLRQMNTPTGLADNYGWYFAQGAPAYAPSATDSQLGGPYFETAASLTPEYVRDVAMRYLGAAPVAILVSPRQIQVKVSTGGS